MPYRGVEEDVNDIVSVGSGTGNIEDSRSNNFEDLADDKYQGLETSKNFNVLIGSNSGEAAEGGDSEAMLGSTISELAEYSSASAGMNPADLKLSSAGAAHDDASASLTPLHKEGDEHLRHRATAQAASPISSSRSSGSAATSADDLDDSNFDDDDEADMEDFLEESIPESGAQASRHGMSSNQASQGRGGTLDGSVSHHGMTDSENGASFEDNQRGSQSSKIDSRSSSKSGSSSGSSSPSHKAGARQVSTAAGRFGGDGSKGKAMSKDTGASRSRVGESSSVESERAGSKASKSAKPGNSSSSSGSRDSLQASHALSLGTQDDADALVATATRRQLMQHESQDTRPVIGPASSDSPGSRLGQPGRRLLQYDLDDSASNGNSSAEHTSASPPGKHYHNRASAAPAHGRSRSSAKPEHEQERSGFKGQKHTHAGLHESSVECRWEGSEHEEAHPGLLTPTSNHTACRYSNLLLWNNQVRLLFWRPLHAWCQCHPAAVQASVLERLILHWKVKSCT